MKIQFVLRQGSEYFYGFVTDPELDTLEKAREAYSKMQFDRDHVFVDVREFVPGQMKAYV
jgi:hypothetical protein